MTKPLKKKEGKKWTQAEMRGAICGGVISESLFFSDPWAYMMAYYMDDKHFEQYKKEKDERKRHKLFKKYAHSAI